MNAPLSHTKTIVKQITRSLLLAGLLVQFGLVTACQRKTVDSSVSFGSVVTAASVDANNSPTALSDTFSPQQKTVYVVAEAKDIAPGSRLSARWSHEGKVVQVSDVVTSAQGYHNSNIEFHMNPGAEGWIPGKYTVQIMVNDQPGPTANFTIK